MIERAAEPAGVPCHFLSNILPVQESELPRGRLPQLGDHIVSPQHPIPPGLAPRFPLFRGKRLGDGPRLQAQISSTSPGEPLSPKFFESFSQLVGGHWAAEPGHLFEMPVARGLGSCLSGIQIDPRPVRFTGVVPHPDPPERGQKPRRLVLPAGEDAEQVVLRPCALEIPLEPCPCPTYRQLRGSFAQPRQSPPILAGRLRDQLPDDAFHDFRRSVPDLDHPVAPRSCATLVTDGDQREPAAGEGCLPGQKLVGFFPAFVDDDRGPESPERQPSHRGPQRLRARPRLVRVHDPEPCAFRLFQGLEGQPGLADSRRPHDPHESARPSDRFPQPVPDALQAPILHPFGSRVFGPIAPGVPGEEGFGQAGGDTLLYP